MKQQNKKGLITSIIMYLIAITAVVLSFVFYNKIYGETSIFNKSIANNEFVDGLFHKIPALISTIQIIVIALISYKICKFLLSHVFASSNRQITIVKMLNSFIKWFITIVALLMVLSRWGVDTTTLLASAGILTLVIGLGAQSLVADIVAGVFIVLEGEYLVGDIVVIDGWRGTVQEIGIRTTKIVDVGGNIKIINNSQITSIINQTQELSLATCTIGIEYGESLPRVEVVIKENLDKIKKSIPSIVEGPFYKGVTSLNSSSVDLLFVAKCKEEDIYQVQRDLNRELKLLFDTNQINIPFPQVVLNKPVEFSKKEDKSISKKADAFLKEQKELSKDLENKIEVNQ